MKISFYEANLRWFSYNSDDIELPSEISFIYKYFRTKVQTEFLKYYWHFGDYRCFAQHTGYPVDYSYCYKCAAKYEYFIELYRKAKSEFDLDKLVLLQKRRVRVPKKFL